MTQESPLLSILADENDREAANQLANLLGYSFSHIVFGSGADAARYIQQTAIEPRYILFVILGNSDTIEYELDELANYCVSGTKVVVAGPVNDISLYRMLIDKGVQDYFPLPLDVSKIANSFGRASGESESSSDSRVIAFASAGSGDGASTIAVNVAYHLAKEQKARTIIVDMDYQFGMIAKNLDLSSPHGINELLDHPERGIDDTIINKMAVSYMNNLSIISAPNGLQFYPTFPPEVIGDLIESLKARYDYIVLDLPHIWSPWISAAFTRSDHIILVAQLWLKSVSHAASQLNAWKATGVDLQKVHVCVNRSGAKFKEGVSARDFERVCNRQIEHFCSNDIRSAAEAEQKGSTILELKRSKLAEDIAGLSNFINAL
jgi:pilus assembly protein CpaE